MFEKLGTFVQKYAKIIIAVWIVLLICAVPLAMKSSEVLSYDMTKMSGASSEASEGNVIMQENFVSSTQAAAAVVLPYNSQEELDTILVGFGPSGTFQTNLDKIIGEGKTTATYMGNYGKTTSKIPGVALVTIKLDDGVNASKVTPDIRNAVSQTKSDASITTASYVTGSGPMAYDTEKSSVEDVQKIDPLSVLLILILIGIFFSAVITAIVPPAVVGVAYVVVLMGIFALGCIMDIFYITSMIVLVSMLGAGCDYSIFMISRYKEERISGKCKEDAITESVKWAGESVLTSGLAVIIGFGVMAICSFSLVRTMGLVLALGIIVALIASLTFTPALLSLIGDKVFWPRNMEYYENVNKSESTFRGKLSAIGKKYFGTVAKFSIKNAWAVIVVAIVVAAPAAYVVATTNSSYDMVSIMSDTESKEGINVLVDNADGGLIMPTFAIFETDKSIAEIDVIHYTVSWNDEGASALDAINDAKSKILEDENVDPALTLGPTKWTSVCYLAEIYLINVEKIPTPTTEQINKCAVSFLPEAIQGKVSEVFKTTWDIPPATAAPAVDFIVNYGGGTLGGQISETGTISAHYAKIMVTVKDQPMSQTSINTIDHVRSVSHDAVSGSDGVLKNSWTTGYVAILYDLSDTVVEEFKWIEICAIVLVYVLLFFVLGSYFMPIRSLLTIVASIMITIALTTLVFSNLLNTPVIWLIPVVLFVVCLGLGMDYDIFITTRVREGKEKGLSNDEAIVSAMEKAGGIITLCGLIMGGTFLTLLISGSPLLQELGFALGFGILIDALLMVTFVAPALMHVMGDWCWKGPKFLEKKS